ncbi:hypothetical protein M408DRAFT_326832 [Serendipita vermifera MAFF 305830]|uniref:Uncharacterized protein n=1 Tax=Serendipita vermifera MAFF 305830 TaxID=933852 RepID=A0A0C3BJD3_SERVB|nr:hypothetical protein M408DRAFT_326832 [Serendipita vermifera MAFF 305830]
MYDDKSFVVLNRHKALPDLPASPRESGKPVASKRRAKQETMREVGARVADDVQWSKVTGGPKSTGDLASASYRQKQRAPRSKQMKARCHSSRSSRASSIVRHRSTTARESRHSALKVPERKTQKERTLDDPDSHTALQNAVCSSPLLAPTKSSLRRRQRVSKRGSMSETDTVGEWCTSHRPVTYLSPIPGTPSLSKPSKTTRPKSTGNKRVSHRSSKFFDAAPSSSITVHSLPLILPADANYECRVEWESDKGESGTNEAGNLWKRLEQECGLSPIPASPALGSITSPNMGSINKRGRWKVKVLETPTIPAPDLASDTGSEALPIKWTLSPDEMTDIGSFIGIDEDCVPVLREVSVDKILPSLNGYRHLSSVLARRVSTRRRPVIHPQRSSSLRFAKPTSRSIRTAQRRKYVHQDVRHAVRSFWEGWRNGELGIDPGSAHLAMLMSRSQSMNMSRSRLGRTTGMSTSHEPNSVEERVGMHRSLTLKHQASTAGMDSLIGLYVEL